MALGAWLGWRFAPVTGESVLPLAQAFAEGKINRIPYLLGSNSDEGTLFTFTTPIANAEAYAERLAQGYGTYAS
jgi:carboxylesterase type B